VDLRSIDLARVDHVLSTTRAVRKRLDLQRPVEREILERCIEVATQAPTGPEERAMGWYYYLEDRLRFPFEARCIVAKVISPLSTGETVRVLRMAPEDACCTDILVMIGWHGRNIGVPLSQLAAINVDQSTAQAIGDWQYWLGQGYGF